MALMKHTLVWWTQIIASVAGHAAAMPDLTHSVKYEEVEGATKEGLTAKWQEWVQAAGTCCETVTAQGLVAHSNSPSTCALPV